MEYMYFKESLILQLFQEHREYGPHILIYIERMLLGNRPLRRRFRALNQMAHKFHKNDEAHPGDQREEESHAPSPTDNRPELLTDSAEEYLFTRLAKIYMKSRQRSWRGYMDFVPEKGTPSLRENLKAMKADMKTTEDIAKEKKARFKKDMLPDDLLLALDQLRLWSKVKDAQAAFEEAFTVNDLKSLVQAFCVDGKKAKGKKKKLVGMLLEHLRKGDNFNEETQVRGRILF
jgi:hypothetical protein